MDWSGFQLEELLRAPRSSGYYVCAAVGFTLKLHL
jgi:hypothetical protein